MDAKDLFVNDCSQCQIIEYIRAIAPHVDAAKLAQAFVIKSVYLSDLARFVVASDQRDTLWIANFERYQEQEGFNRMTAAIDKVAHEEVVCVWTFSTNLKELFQVIKLTVDVSTDLKVNQKIFLTYRDWALNVLYIALLLKNLSGSIAKRFDICFLDGLASF